MQDLAEAINNALVNQQCVAVCAPSNVPQVVQVLGKALCPLVEAALQPHDWVQPSHLLDLDACSLLLASISSHLHKSYHTPWMASLVSSMQASGLLATLPNTMDRACRVLTAPDSPAPTDVTFTQYLASLMTLWSDLFRLTPSGDCLGLEDANKLGHLLLPGAQLAAAALRIYAGPDGARIMAANIHAEGHLATVLTSVKYTQEHIRRYPALVQQLRLQMVHALGRVVCASAIANTLRVADTLSIIAYNATRRYGTIEPHSLFGPERRTESLADKVLGDAAVAKLVAAMLFVQVKRLHTQQAGNAGVAVPRTRTSGRIKQGAPSASGSAPAVQVPPHHNLIAGALGLDLLMADEELFLQVTGYGPTADMPKIDLTRHDIDSIMVDPLKGLATIVLHALNTTSLSQRVHQCSVLSQSYPTAKSVRIAAHLNDKLSQAVLLTAVELCMLQPKEHVENALRLSSYTTTGLLHSFISHAGADAVAQFCRHHTSGAAQWVEGPNLVSNPDLTALMAPVFRDSVTCLVPLLLPECHNIPLPASGAAGPSGSQLSAMLPQQIIVAAATVDQSVLAELLQEHPLYTTRGLEAALRADWTEQSVAPVLRSSLLKAIPAVLSSLVQPSGAMSSSAAAAAAAPSKLAAALVAPNSRQLLLQLHALLVSVAKYAAGLNGRALAAAADPQRHQFILTKESIREQMELGMFLHHLSMPPALKQLSMRMIDTDAENAAKMLAPQSTAGRFRGTLELMSGVAAAAAALGRAVSLAAAGSTPTPAVGATSSSACSAGSSSRDVQPLLAPFVSLIGRCLYLTGAALSAASTQAPPGLEPAEFASCSSILAALLSCLEWLAAEPGGCKELLASTGAADAAAVSELHGSLQAQLMVLQGEASAGAAAAALEGLAVADRLCESGLTGQLQAVGAAMCGVSTGVCGNPGCLCLLELSEIALVTPGGGKKKGCGKCSACATTSYCSRDCQKAHWRSGHKAFCRAHQQPAAAPVADAAPAASPGDAAA